MQDSEPINLDLNHMCRACLQQADNMTEFSSIIVLNEVQITFKEIYLSCYKFTDNINMPVKICLDCVPQLINAYDFKLKCEKNEKYLISLLKLAGEYVEEPRKVEITVINSTDDEMETDADDAESDADISEFEKGKQLKYGFRHVAEDVNERKCEHCGKESTGRYQLLRHLRRVHNVHNRCEICQRAFTRGKYLRKHMKFHAKTKCPICADSFETHTALTSHLNSKVHASEALEIADKSKKQITLPDDCPNHLPNGPKSIQCKLCSLHMKSIFELREHLKGHKEIDSLKCEVFDRELRELLGFDGSPHIEAAVIGGIIKCIEKGDFSRFYSIMNENYCEMFLSDSETESETEPEKPVLRSSYTCELCSISFDRNYKMQKHHRENHTDGKKCFPCPICGFKFFSEDLLNSHLLAKCREINKRFICDKCDLKFMWESNLKIHQFKHDGEHGNSFEENEEVGEKEKEQKNDEAEQKFQCTACSRIFGKETHYHKHIQIHNRQNSKCFHCGKTFTNFSGLGKHLGQHFDMKWYECLKCKRAFQDKTVLKKHMILHAKIGNTFKCAYCNRSFVKRMDLLRHAPSHEGNFNCKSCNFTCSSYRLLILHEYERHSTKASIRIPSLAV